MIFFIIIFTSVINKINDYIAYLFVLFYNNKHLVFSTFFNYNYFYSYTIK